jgi:hypothetical protein
MICGAEAPTPEEIMISEIDAAIVEIGSGAWFLTSFSLVLVFGYHVVQHFLYDPEWKTSVTLQASLAFIAYGLGSAMRAGLAWARFSSGDFEGASFIITWWPWFEISILLNAIGAAAAIYILSPGWRSLASALVVAVAFVIPTVIYLA